MAEILNDGVLPYSYYHGRREVHQLFGIMIKCAIVHLSNYPLPPCPKNDIWKTLRMYWEGLKKNHLSSLIINGKLKIDINEACNEFCMIWTLWQLSKSSSREVWSSSLQSHHDLRWEAPPQKKLKKISLF